MTISQYEELTLEEKEKYWIQNIEQKSSMEDDYDMSDEQYEYEWEYQVLYEDDVIRFSKQYVDNMTIEKVDESRGHFGCETCWEVLIDKKDGDLGRLLKDDTLKGMTIVDYNKKKGIPTNISNMDLK